MVGDEIMQKYIKNDLSDVRYYENRVDVSKYINLEEYRLMTEAEILKNELNPHTDYHVWDEELLEWIDSRTSEQIAEYKRSQYPKLTRYQFMRGLLEMGFKSSDIEAQILLIEDEYTRELTMIGFKDAGYFVRTDPSIGVMRDILGKTDLEIDEFWEQCLLF